MNVVILDTGCANLNSVKSAIARHGYEPVVSRDPDVVLRADKLFLPGVGTAQAAMDQPHMGWNRVYAKAGDRLFRGIEDGAYFYFVHSYAMPVNANTIAQCNYGEAFTAAVQKDNFFGVQFHPERSGAAGAQLLKNFLEM